MPSMITVPSLFPPPTYSHAAVVPADAELVFTAGGVPLDAEGVLVGQDDPAAQTRQVLANLDAALRAAGSELGKVVASTVYVVAGKGEHDVLDAVWDVVVESELSDRSSRSGPHTSTLLGVSLLGYPGQSVEITAVAVR